LELLNEGVDEEDRDRAKLVEDIAVLKHLHETNTGEQLNTAFVNDALKSLTVCWDLVVDGIANLSSQVFKGQVKAWEQGDRRLRIVLMLLVYNTFCNLPATISNVQNHWRTLKNLVAKCRSLPSGLQNHAQNPNLQHLSV